MGVAYFCGKSGGFVLDDYEDTFFKIQKWTYIKDKGLVDISNTNALGTDQYIGNLNSGSIKASGFMTDEQLKIFNDNEIEAGQEVTFNLYFDILADTPLGFENIQAVIDDITFGMDYTTNGTFLITALISEPKL